MESGGCINYPWGVRTKNFSGEQDVKFPTTCKEPHVLPTGRNLIYSEYVFFWPDKLREQTSRIADWCPLLHLYSFPPWVVINDIGNKVTTRICSAVLFFFIQNPVDYSFVESCVLIQCCQHSPGKCVPKYNIFSEFHLPVWWSIKFYSFKTYKKISIRFVICQIMFDQTKINR